MVVDRTSEADMNRRIARKIAKAHFHMEARHSFGKWLYAMRYLGHVVHQWSFTVAVKRGTGSARQP